MKSMQPGITAETTVKVLSYCTSQYLQCHICRFTVKYTVLSLTAQYPVVSQQTNL